MIPSSLLNTDIKETDPSVRIKECISITEVGIVWILVSYDQEYCPL